MPTINLKGLKGVKNRALPKNVRFILLGLEDKIDKDGNAEVLICDDWGSPSYKPGGKSKKTGKDFSASFKVNAPLAKPGGFGPVGWTPSEQHVWLRQGTVICVESATEVGEPDTGAPDWA